jgi:hypothetical protein
MRTPSRLPERKLGIVRLTLNCVDIGIANKFEFKTRSKASP